MGSISSNNDKYVADEEKQKAARRVYVRDRLVINEVSELVSTLPPTCKLSFDDPDKLYDFKVTIIPDEGYWKNGKFTFHILVTEEYNFAPPTVKCQTRIWHPNINEEGSVCLSLLRQASIEDVGWAPTRHLKDVVWGLNSLFTDLVNFDDPLNNEAAEMYKQDPIAFKRKVTDYIKLNC